jgi:pimeloyl-ACP methyl ester carboxylesterase
LIAMHARTSVLDIAYEESGNPAGPAIVLWHGWPDSLRTWDAIVPPLADAGFRVLVPELRGFGGTRFRDASTPRSAQATALAQDALDFLDALRIERAIAVGHDWGAFAVYLLAAMAPERVTRAVALSVGYGINNPANVPAIEQAQAFWYHWFFQSRQGETAFARDHESFCRHIWRIWMPTRA